MFEWLRSCSARQLSRRSVHRAKRSRLALAAIITFNLGLLGYYTPAQNEWVRVEQHS
jgi:hypothetical protein